MIARTFWASAVCGTLLALIAQIAGAPHHAVSVPLLINPNGWNSLRNLLVIDIFIFANMLFALVLLTIFRNGSMVRERRTSWRDYGADRGLAVQRAPSAAMVDMPFMAGRHHVQFTSTIAGPVGETQMTIGTAKWRSGTGSERREHTMFYASVEVPTAIAELIPASSFSRTSRPLLAADLALEFEAVAPTGIKLNAGFELRVSIDAELDVVGALFTDEMLGSLTSSYDVQWQQVGTTMVFCADGLLLGQAPHGTLDTMCLGAAYVAQKFNHAAAGLVAHPRVA
ncbi:MAG: hypothetical protein H7123_08650 [Thermoleophilia bacterium]|nr:hypothetical protein [Thermoleophilia bacterium]